MRTSEAVVGDTEVGQKKTGFELAGFVTISRHRASFPEAIANEICLNPGPFIVPNLPEADLTDCLIVAQLPDRPSTVTLSIGDVFTPTDA
jgi:hypothetical protein